METIRRRLSQFYKRAQLIAHRREHVAGVTGLTCLVSTKKKHLACAPNVSQGHCPVLSRRLISGLSVWTAKGGVISGLLKLSYHTRRHFWGKSDHYGVAEGKQTHSSFVSQARRVSPVWSLSCFTHWLCGGSNSMFFNLAVNIVERICVSTTLAFKLWIHKKGDCRAEDTKQCLDKKDDCRLKTHKNSHPDMTFAVDWALK